MTSKSVHCVAIFLHEEIDASRFSGPEQFFAGAPYIFCKETERRFSRAESTDTDASIDRGARKRFWDPNNFLRPWVYFPFDSKIDSPHSYRLPMRMSAHSRSPSSSSSLALTLFLLTLLLLLPFSSFFFFPFSFHRCPRDKFKCALDTREKFVPQ